MKMQHNYGYARPQCSSLTSRLPHAKNCHLVLSEITPENESGLIDLLHTVTLHAKTLRAKEEGMSLARKRAIDCLDDAQACRIRVPDKP